MSTVVLFIGLLIGQCTVTSYRSLPNQTDSSPNFTSIGDRTHKGGVAVSRDLICGACRRLHRRCDHPEVGKGIHYGDYVSIGELGIFKVNDIMGATMYDKVHHKRVPIVQHFDIWCASFAEEKKIGVQHLKVYILHEK